MDCTKDAWPSRILMNVLGVLSGYKIVFSVIDMENCNKKEQFVVFIRFLCILIS